MTILNKIRFSLAKILFPSLVKENTELQRKTKVMAEGIHAMSVVIKSSKGVRFNIHRHTTPWISMLDDGELWAFTKAQTEAVDVRIPPIPES